MFLFMTFVLPLRTMGRLLTALLCATVCYYGLIFNGAPTCCYALRLSSSAPKGNHVQLHTLVHLFNGAVEFLVSLFTMSYHPMHSLPSLSSKYSMLENFWEGHFWHPGMYFNVQRVKDVSCTYPVWNGYTTPGHLAFMKAQAIATIL